MQSITYYIFHLLPEAVSFHNVVLFIIEEVIYHQSIPAYNLLYYQKRIVFDVIGNFNFLRKRT